MWAPSLIMFWYDYIRTITKILLIYLGLNEYKLVDTRNRCATVSYKSLRSSSLHMSNKCDAFILTPDFHLKHAKTGLCVEPTSWYGNYRNWEKLFLSGNCAGQASVFIPIGEYILHAASGKYLDQSYGNIMRISPTPRTKLKLETSKFQNWRFQRQC